MSEKTFFEKQYESVVEFYRLLDSKPEDKKKVEERSKKVWEIYKKICELFMEISVQEAFWIIKALEIEVCNKVSNWKLYHLTREKMEAYKRMEGIS